jgi:predicted signal transduction protein with EAL and GGDEF domain
MILLPESGLSKASVVAEKIRDTFALRSCLSVRKKDAQKFTFSMGVAQVAKGEDSESFIKRADMAMYEAKNEGGDRIRKARRSIGRQISSKSHAKDRKEAPTGTGRRIQGQGRGIKKKDRKK